MQDSIIHYLLNRYQLKAQTTDEIGVWMSANRKIASFGFRVSRGITSHGISLNLSNEVLPWFKHIVPCGLKDVEMTSVEKELDTINARYEKKELVIDDLMINSFVTSLRYQFNDTKVE
jgi:lipoyl(octanoyl) transferase